MSLKPTWALAIAATLLSSCGTNPAPPASGEAPKTPGATYRVLVDEDPGPLHSAQRRSYCIRYQCAFTTAGYRPECIKACTDSWALDRPAHPRPSTGPVARPHFHFDSDHQEKGVLGTIRLSLGKHVFRGRQTGQGNFILYATQPGDGPEVIFNEQDAGSWTYTLQVTKNAPWEIDLKWAYGDWSIDID